MAVVALRLTSGGLILAGVKVDARHARREWDGSDSTFVALRLTIGGLILADGTFVARRLCCSRLNGSGSAVGACSRAGGGFRSAKPILADSTVFARV